MLPQSKDYCEHGCANDSLVRDGDRRGPESKLGIHAVLAVVDKVPLLVQGVRDNIFSGHLKERSRASFRIETKSELYESPS